MMGMNCKNDCIHYDVCIQKIDMAASIAKTGLPCSDFIDKKVFSDILHRKDDAKPNVRAEWNETPTQFKCSVCGTTQLLKSNYCPHCGADMQGDKRRTEKK